MFLRPLFAINRKSHFLKNKSRDNWCRETPDGLEVLYVYAVSPLLWQKVKAVSCIPMETCFIHTEVSFHLTFQKCFKSYVIYYDNKETRDAMSKILIENV